MRVRLHCKALPNSQFFLKVPINVDLSVGYLAYYLSLSGESFSIGREPISFWVHLAVIVEKMPDFVIEDGIV